MGAPSYPSLSQSSRRRKLEEGDHASPLYWPGDVIQEILVRLPLKSILRFKSICKNWYSLIRSRPFIELHRVRCLEEDDHVNELFFSRIHTYLDAYIPKKTPYIVSSLSYRTSSGLERNFTPLFDLKMLRQALVGDEVDPPLRKTLALAKSGIFVLSPLSNGISCVIAQEFVENTKSQETYVYYKVAFCNLSTREFRLLRDPFPFTRECFEEGGARIHLEHFYGFGSIQSRDGVAVDYKMVAIEQSELHDRTRVAVYSERRGSWKIIPPKVVGQHEFPKITQDLSLLPVQALLNGSCHWMATKKQYNDSDREHCILRFDLSKKVFGVIEAPPKDEYRQYSRGYVVGSHVFVLDDHLAVVTIAEGCSGWLDTLGIGHIDVWMMMEYGVETTWAKIHSCQVYLEGRLTRVLGMSLSTRADDGDGTTIDKVFFECGPTRGGMELISCDGYGVQRHRNIKGYLACWKPLGLSPYVETLEPVSLQS